MNPVQGKPLSYHLKTFDFIGLFTIVGGTVLLLVGFNSGETSWVCGYTLHSPTYSELIVVLQKSAETIALLVVGCILVAACVVNEIYTKRQPIVSPRLFKTRTTGALLISNFLHGLVYFAAAY